MSASLAPECNEVKEYVWSPLYKLNNKLTPVQTLRHMLLEVVQRK